MILAADIGGTNARVALFRRGQRAPILVQTYRTDAWSCADDVLRAFCATHSAALSSACVAVAGPVADGRCQAVNLPWPVDAAALAGAVGLPDVALVNDLEANARGVLVLAPHELAVVNRGRFVAGGTRAVVSAGTGLGEAALWWDGEQYRAIAGEGGHADFAPRTEIEIALFRFLAEEYGHVSYERVCSGQGLVNIYRFFRQAYSSLSARPTGEPAPSPAAISAEAAADSRSIGALALDLFMSIYGARAGNVALAFMATGGVYLGGGMAPKLVERFADGPFMRAFVDKGRFSSLLASVPVRVVLNEHTALLGAATIASERQTDSMLEAADAA